MKQLRQYLFIVASLFFSLPIAFSQLEDSYQIVSNEAEIPKFELTINPFDFKNMQGINVGAGVNVKLRPLSRIGVDGRFSSMFYTNSYRQKYDGNNRSAIKSMGGISAYVVGEFIWRKKGIIFPNGKFLISRNTKSDGFTSTTTTNYIPVKYNELVERNLRGGILYDNFPVVSNTLSAVSLALGLGKRTSYTMVMDINGQQRKQSSYVQYAFEVLVGVPQYADPTLVDNNQSVGFRFILERQWKSKNAKEVRGWKNLDITIELGSKPGGFPYLGTTVGIPALSFGKNRVPDRINYKAIKEPKRFIGRFLRFI